MTSADWYTLFIGVIAAQRLIELGVSSRNTARARARGGLEAGAAHYPAMIALHVAFLASCVLEVRMLGRPWIPVLGVPMLALVACGMALRYWVVVSMHGRWTTRLVYVPGDPLVTNGPFRWLRHPNYAAVVAEVAAIPLVHSAWLTAIGFTLANGVILRRRIQIEDAFLNRLSNSPRSVHERR